MENKIFKFPEDAYVIKQPEFKKIFSNLIGCHNNSRIYHEQIIVPIYCGNGFDFGKFYKKGPFLSSQNHNKPIKIEKYYFHNWSVKSYCEKTNVAEIFYSHFTTHKDKYKTINDWVEEYSKAII